MEDREVSQDRQQGFTSFLKFKKTSTTRKKGMSDDDWK